MDQFVTQYETLLTRVLKRRGSERKHHIEQLKKYFEISLYEVSKIYESVHLETENEQLKRDLKAEKALTKQLREWVHEVEHERTEFHEELEETDEIMKNARTRNQELQQEVMHMGNKFTEAQKELRELKEKLSALSQTI